MAWPASDDFSSFTIPRAQPGAHVVDGMTSVDLAVASRFKMQPKLLVDERPDTPSVLPKSGLPATIVQHMSQPSRGVANEIIGDTLMTQDEHRFVFTVLRGSGTGMRVGVASANGSCNWGIRIFDGRLTQHVPQVRMQSAAAARSKDNDDSNVDLNLPIAMGGGNLPPKLCQGPATWDRAGLRIEVTVNMTMRTLVFHVASSGKAFDTGIRLPKEGVRPWFESRLIGDTIALSEHRVRPGHSILVVRRPLARVTRSSTPEARRPSSAYSSPRATSPRRTASPSLYAPTSPRAKASRACSPRGFGSSSARFRVQDSEPAAAGGGTPGRRRSASAERSLRPQSPMSSRVLPHCGSRTTMSSSTIHNILRDQETLLKQLKQAGFSMSARAPVRAPSPTRPRKHPDSPAIRDELQSARFHVEQLAKENAFLRSQISPEPRNLPAALPLSLPAKLNLDVHVDDGLPLVPTTSPVDSPRLEPLGQMEEAASPVPVGALSEPVGGVPGGGETLTVALAPSPIVPAIGRKDWSVDSKPAHNKPAQRCATLSHV